MIDPRLLREDPDLLRDSLRRRGSTIDLDSLIALEAAVRAKRQEAEGLRARQKESGRLIATLAGAEKEAAIGEVAELAAAVREAMSEADRLVAEFDRALLEVPNLVAPDAADGQTETDSLEIKRVGSPRSDGRWTTWWRPGSPQ